MSNNTITISMKEYISLKRDECFLQRLQNAGVDNWQGYSYAFDDEENEHEDCKWCNE